MHVTVPQQQTGPALSGFAQRSSSLPLAPDPSLRGGVTRCDCSTCQGLFFTIEPRLTELHAGGHTLTGKLTIDLRGRNMGMAQQLLY
jgi:hypothetical protein